MRLGQCAVKLGKFDMAIVKYTNAKDLLRTELKKYKSSGNWSDELPEVDYLHMRVSIPRLMGYCYWTKGKKTSVKKQKLTFLKRAYETTEELSSLDINDKEAICKMNNKFLSQEEQSKVTIGLVYDFDRFF